MIQKCKNTPGGDDTVLTHDKKAIQTRDTKGIAKLPKRYTLFFLYCIRYYCYYSPTLFPLQYIINNERYVS